MYECPKFLLQTDLRKLLDVERLNASDRELILAQLSRCSVDLSLTAVLRFALVQLVNGAQIDSGFSAESAYCKFRCSAPVEADVEFAHSFHSASS